MESEPRVPASPAAAGRASEPLHPARAIAAGWRTFLAHPWITIGAMLLVLVIACAGQVIPVLGVLFALLAMPALSTGAAGWLLRRARGQNPDIGALFDGFRRWPSTTGAWWIVLLVTLVIEIPMIVAVFATLGLQALLHPRHLASGAAAGLGVATFAVIGAAFVVVMPLLMWWSCRMSMVYFAVMEPDRPGAIESLRRSWALTRGSVWRLVGLALLSIPIVLLGLIALCVGVVPAYLTLAYAWVDAYEQLRARLAPAAAPAAPVIT